MHECVQIDCSQINIDFRCVDSAIENAFESAVLSGIIYVDVTYTQISCCCRRSGLLFFCLYTDRCGQVSRANQ